MKEGLAFRVRVFKASFRDEQRRAIGSSSPPCSERGYVPAQNAARVRIDRHVVSVKSILVLQQPSRMPSQWRSFGTDAQQFSRQFFCGERLDRPGCVLKEDRDGSHS